MFEFPFWIAMVIGIAAGGGTLKNEPARQIETVKITLFYDDGTSDTVTFSRNQILMP